MFHLCYNRLRYKQDFGLILYGCLGTMIVINGSPFEPAGPRPGFLLLRYTIVFFFFFFPQVSSASRDLKLLSAIIAHSGS